MTLQWRHTWVGNREVFTAPDGTEWVRATPETATLTIPMTSPGLGPLYLKPGSVTHLKALAARKARRLDKRVRRLRKHA